MHENRDYITVEDEHGKQKEFLVEALFEMNGQSYALLSSQEETVLMRVENEHGKQSLVGIAGEEKEALLAAYELAVKHSHVEGLWSFTVNTPRDV